MIKIVKAERNHKHYILFANNQIHYISQQNIETRLEKHIDSDYFCDVPKFNCLIAEFNGKPVGMCIYSKMYWADDGEVLWISQIFVNPENRKDGIFFALLSELKKKENDAKVISCATANSNKTMQKLLEFYGAKVIDMKFYAKIIE